MLLEPGEGNALHSFASVAKATEHFLMILGALESDEAPLSNPYLDVFRFFIGTKCSAQEKNVTFIGKSRDDVMNSSDLLPA